MIPGFPSYCADSLSMITSSVTCCRCPCIGHHVFLHTRPNNRPNQVRLRYVPSTSYRFLQTPPLAGDALASRILFPMDGVRPLASSGWVCQLRWANKKRLLLDDDQRRLLAVKAHAIGRKALFEITTVFTPDTILRWHRELVAKKFDSSDKRKPGRPRMRQVIVDAIVRFARENPTWV